MTPEKRRAKRYGDCHFSDSAVLKHHFGIPKRIGNRSAATSAMQAPKQNHQNHLAKQNLMVLPVVAMELGPAPAQGRS